MNHHDHASAQSIWRPLHLPMKLLVILVTLPTFSSAQFSSKTPEGAICPLSESQTQKSIEAFSKIASTIANEPRCLGCHGRVNPFIEGTGPDPAEPDRVASQFEHGAGAVDRSADCNECHSKMARRTRDGSESKWMTAPDFLSFIGKDAPTLCKQIRDNIPTAKDFLGHLKDDNGGNNFAGTAFNGDRGLDRTMFSEKEVPTQKPHITKVAFMKLAQDWINTTGGEFKGDKSCGCEPAHYAIRYSTSTEVNIESIHHTSAMEPADIPITFKDDGTYTGDGTGVYKAGGTAAGCTEQSTLNVAFNVSGQAIETSEKQSMHIDLEYPSPMAYTMTAECDGESGGAQANIPSMNVKASFDMKGEVEEKIDKEESAMAGIVSKLQVKIVKVPEPAP